MNWPTATLGDICRPKQHKTIPAKDLHADGYPVYGANGQIGFYSEFTHNQTTIAVTCRGATCGTINVVPPMSYITGNAMALDHLDETKADLSYLAHVLRFQGFESVITGAAQPQITRAPLLEYQIPLPPLEEQKRIAGILDQAAELCRLRTRALDKLNTLGQAIFQEMFGGGLEPTSVQQLLDQGVLLLHKDGNHGSNYPRKEEFGETGVPFLSAKAINDEGIIAEETVEYLNEEKARNLKIGWITAGDVLLSHNASVGKVALYGGDFGDALIGTSLTCYRPNPKFLTSSFLEFALKSLDFQHQLSANMSQTTRNQVPITAQKRLTLQIPGLAAQINFEDRTKALRQSAASASAALVKSEALFASLQHRAFRGEL